MRIEIANRQRLCGIDRKKLRCLTVFLMRRACGPQDMDFWGEISLVLTDDSGIREINRRVFASAEVTDVISSRYDPIPGENALPTGEIAINVQRAMEQTIMAKKSARSQGNRWTTARELALYIAHGCDHLAGQDNDADRAGRIRMRRRDLKWLREAESEDLLDGLIHVL